MGLGHEKQNAETMWGRGATGQERNPRVWLRGTGADL